MLGLLTFLLAPLAVRAGLAGNEDFAHSRRLHSHVVKTLEADPFASAVSTVSFGVGDKTLMSPIGETMKRYTLDLTEGSFGSNTFMPVTVIHAGDGFTCDSLTRTVELFNAVDDVWDASIFMKGVVLQTASADASVASALASCLSDWNTTFIAISGPHLPDLASPPALLASFYGESEIPQGPYIASVSPSGNRAHLTPVYRVYRDENQAFTSPAVPDATGNRFLAITAQVAGMSTQSIPVPSRLYTLNATNARPLEGMRVAVKDMFDMEGLRTGCGNRAYFNTYAPRNESASVVKKLISLGAIIVGKDKTSQFANGESATDDWVDQMAPFNPRGDGYQDPQTSSAGSGAALGAYDWLDFTIGSDTGGSVRGPAARQGLFGMRPSHGAISLAGAMPLCSPLDSAGFFARDALNFRKIGKAWYGDAFRSYPSLPQTVYMSDDVFPLPSTAAPGAQKIYTKFYNDLADFLNATVDTRSLATIWNSTVSESVGGVGFADYLNTTYPTMVGYYQARPPPHSPHSN